MRKLLAFIISLFFSILATGQNRISYNYDSAGNRTGRAASQQVTALSQGQWVTNQQVLFTRPNPKFIEHDCRAVQEGCQRAAGRFWLTERTDMPWRAVYAGFACSANFGLGTDIGRLPIDLGNNVLTLKLLKPVKQ